MATSTVTLLVAHGSRNPATERDHVALADRVATAAGACVVPAFLELSQPSVPDAVDAAVSGGATTVVIVPLFLHVGNHVERDLPALAATARERHPGVTIRLDEHIGADALLVQLVADRIRPDPC